MGQVHRNTFYYLKPLDERDTHISRVPRGSSRKPNLYRYTIDFQQTYRTEIWSFEAKEIGHRIFLLGWFSVEREAENRV